METNRTSEYLYCLVPGTGQFQLQSPGVEGLGGVRVVPCGTVGAVAGPVPSDAFCGERAEEALSNLALLGPRVFRHEAVIEEAMRAGAVLPMRFATLFHSTESLQAAICGREASIRAFFDTIGDRLEWAVKGVLNRAEALSQLAARVDAAAGAPDSPGLRYFQERRARAQAEKELPVRLRAFRQRAANTLCLCSSDFQERSVPPDDGTPEAAIVLNWAFLLRPSELASWQAEVARLQGEDGFPLLSLVVSGPFAPYSFAPSFSDGVEP